MIRLFKNSSPLVLIILVITTFLLRLPVLVLDLPAPLVSHAGILDSLSMIIFNTHFQWSNTWHYILGSSIVLFMAFYMQHIILKHKVMDKSGFLPAYSIILLCSIHQDFLFVTAPLLSMLFILLAFTKIYTAYFVEKAQSKILDAGLFTGFAAILYLPSSIFILSIFIALVLLKTLSLRQVILYFFAILIPFYLLAAGLFVSGNLLSFLAHNDYTVLMNHQKFSAFQPKPTEIMTAVFLLMILMTGVVKTQNEANKSLAHIRKFYGTGVIILISCILSILLCNCLSITHAIVAVIPACGFFVNFYKDLKRAWLGELIHLILLVLIFLSYLINQ